MMFMTAFLGWIAKPQAPRSRRPILSRKIPTLQLLQQLIPMMSRWKCNRFLGMTFHKPLTETRNQRWMVHHLLINSLLFHIQGTPRTDHERRPIVKNVTMTSR